VWSWAYWIKIECIGWLLWAFRFHGMKRVYWSAEILSASQKDTTPRR
jgi:hypothetical protein